MTQAAPRKELVIRQLLDHAAGLFARNGFGGTSLREIADTAGMSRTSLYHYFASKEDVLAALIEDVTLVPKAKLDEIRLDGALSPREKLKAAARMLVLRVLANPTKFRVVDRDEANLPDGIAQRHQQAKRDSLAGLASIVAEGIAAGQFRAVDPHVAALTVFGMCNWPAWWFSPGGKKSMPEVADVICDMIVGALQITEKAISTTPLSLIDGIRGDLALLEQMFKSGQPALPEPDHSAVG